MIADVGLLGPVANVEYGLAMAHTLAGAHTHTHSQTHVSLLTVGRKKHI